jgi:hypothetical protein
MKSMHLIGAQTIGILTIGILSLGALPVTATNPYPPAMTDGGMTDGGITDGGMTDGDPSGPKDGHSLHPGNKKEPKKYIQNKHQVHKAKELADKLSKAYTACKSTGNCHDYHKLSKEASSLLKQLKTEKQYKKHSGKMW